MKGHIHLRHTNALAIIAALIALAASVATLKSADTTDSAAGPRAGKYGIYSYGVATSPPIYLGYFILADGTYKAFLPGDKPEGEGAYRYDAAKHEISWTSGPYAGVWGGAFTVERDGKRHQIRMKSSTVASNDAP